MTTLIKKLLIKKFLFPEDIVENILVYLGKIVDRNGRYMTQFSSEDYRYKIFEQIPRPILIKYFTDPNIYSRDFMYQINFINPEHKMYITFTCRGDKETLYTMLDNSVGRRLSIDYIR